MKDLIYCQRDIPAEKWRYGLRTSAATGCGWIATYNALRLMGYYAEPEKLIRMYERMLPIVHGNAGTSIPAPALAFRNWGFPVKMLANSARFDEAAREADVSILFYYWRNKWKFGPGPPPRLKSCSASPRPTVCPSRLPSSPTSPTCWKTPASPPATRLSTTIVMPTCSPSG